MSNMPVINLSNEARDHYLVRKCWPNLDDEAKATIQAAALEALDVAIAGGKPRDIDRALKTLVFMVGQDEAARVHGDKMHRLVHGEPTEIVGDITYRFTVRD